jgi:hypothetical protein
MELERLPSRLALFSTSVPDLGPLESMGFSRFVCCLEAAIVGSG